MATDPKTRRALQIRMLPKGDGLHGLGLSKLREALKQEIAAQTKAPLEPKLEAEIERFLDGTAADIRQRILDELAADERLDSDLFSEPSVQDRPVPGETTTPAQARGKPGLRHSSPLPDDAGHEVTRQKQSVATHYRLDAEELHLSAMAAAAGSEVAARAVSADPEELRELRDVRRLWNLRLDLHQKSKVAAGFPEMLNEAQYRFAKSLAKTASEIGALELKLFGPDQVSEKGEVVREVQRRASDYQYEPKRIRPRRERSDGALLPRKVNG